MRTTVTLDRDVAGSGQGNAPESVRIEGDDQRRPAAGPAARDAAPKPAPFAVQPQALGVKPGINLDRMNQLVDLLDAEVRAPALRR